MALTHFNRTTTTNATPTAASGSVSFTVADASKLVVGLNKVIPQQPGRYDPDDGDLTGAQCISITDITGSTVTATLGVEGTTAQAIKFGYYILSISAGAGGTINIPSPVTRAAISAAVSALSTVYVATGDPGVVQLPAGDFTLEDTTPITLASGVVVKGQGKGSTILRSPTTGSAYTMFRSPGTAAAVNYASGRTALTGNATMGQRYVDIASTTGWAAGDYLTISAVGTGAHAIAQTMRVRAVTSGTRLTMYEPTRDTFNTAKTASILKMSHMLTHSGLKDMTLVGTTATGAGSYGLNVYEFDNCYFDIATEGWTGTGAYAGASLIIGYRSFIRIEDEGSGGSTVPAIQPQLLSECEISLYAHNPASIGVRADFLHGNIIPTLFSEGQQSRGIKLSCCCRNAIGTIYSSGARLDDPGEGRSFVFSDSSHHNSVGAIQSGDNVQLDVWFDGGISGVNDASAFSDDYNSVGAIASGGAASAVNVYVGANCVGNHIASLTPASCTLDDLSAGLGITIGTAMPVQFRGDGDIKARDGTPTYEPLAGSNDLYGSWDMATGESVIINWLVPRTYASNVVRPVLIWTNRSAGSGNVVWNADLLSTPMGTSINGGTLAVNVETAIAAPSQDVPKRSALNAGVIVAPGDIVTIVILRSATLDTLGANDVGLIAVELVPA